MKLELKYLANYLPYGLKVKSKSAVWDLRTLTLSMVGSLERTNKRHIYHESWLIEDTNFKPILRPLSDLTKEIEHNGEKFVPLVELFKISKGNYQQEIKYHSVMSTHQIQIEMLGFRNYFFGLYESDRDVRIENGLYFDCYSTDLIMDNRFEEKILCQYSLFEKLFEWHFDVFGLIEKGLAIDKNTIK